MGKKFHGVDFAPVLPCLCRFRPFSIRSERSAVAFSDCFAFGLRALLRGFRFKALKRRFLGRLLSSWINTQLFFFRAFMGHLIRRFDFGRVCRPSIWAGGRPSL